MTWKSWQTDRAEYRNCKEPGDEFVARYSSAGALVRALCKIGGKPTETEVTVKEAFKG